MSANVMALRVKQKWCQVWTIKEIDLSLHLSRAPPGWPPALLLKLPLSTHQLKQ